MPCFGVSLRPEGAPGCSHGWSGGAAQPADAQPVELGRKTGPPRQGRRKRGSREHAPRECRASASSPSHGHIDPQRVIPAGGSTSGAGGGTPPRHLRTNSLLTILTSAPTLRAHFEPAPPSPLDPAQLRFLRSRTPRRRRVSARRVARRAAHASGRAFRVRIAAATQPRAPPRHPARSPRAAPLRRRPPRRPRVHVHPLRRVLRRLLRTPRPRLPRPHHHLRHLRSPHPPRRPRTHRASQPPHGPPLPLAPPRRPPRRDQPPQHRRLFRSRRRNRTPRRHHPPPRLRPRPPRPAGLHRLGPAAAPAAGSATSAPPAHTSHTGPRILRSHPAAERTHPARGVAHRADRGAARPVRAHHGCTPRRSGRSRPRRPTSLDTRTRPDRSCPPAAPRRQAASAAGTPGTGHCSARRPARS